MPLTNFEYRRESKIRSDRRHSFNCTHHRRLNLSRNFFRFLGLPA
jgi:hypothetical protein